jgi:hypothetical protein
MNTLKEVMLLIANASLHMASLPHTKPGRNDTMHLRLSNYLRETTCQ